jgi:hypothetical protein
MCRAGFEIHDVAVRFVFGVVVAAAAGASLVSSADMPFHFVSGMER